MFNPYYPFTKQALDGFVKNRMQFFVRQTFHRGKDLFDEETKGWYMISHYTELSTAQAHLSAIEHDPNKYLYSWENEEDKKKLELAARGVKGYKIYSNTVRPDWEKLITNRIRQKMASYITSKGWKPARGETVDTSFYQVFGELYIKIKFRGKEVGVKFEEIEKIF
jgi:hypothetical protein